MKNYLVTGAAGFIGGALAQKLINDGHNVYTIDNLSTGYSKNIPDGVVFIEGDVQDKQVIAQLDDTKMDAIFHIAGQSSGEISFENPVYDLQTNTQSTLLLLEYAYRSECKKFIYASTMSIYGDQDILPVTEEHNPNPKSFYAVGKLASENYLKIYSQFGINCSAIRLFSVYGPGQNMDNLKQGMISIFLAQALKENKITVKGSTDRFRDFVYIDDAVESFIKALELDQDFQTINICSGVKLTINDLLKSITAGVGDKIDIDIQNGTKGDQFGIYGDNTKAATILNWQPKVNFKEGSRLMYNWAKINRK
jgi:UDP-glucose 4-epimerase